MLDAISNGLFVDNVVDSDRAAETLEVLEELGLVAGRAKIEERAEEIAQERLTPSRPNTGWPGDPTQRSEQSMKQVARNAPRMCPSC